MYRLMWPQQVIGNAYRRLLDEWLPDSSEAVAQRLCMELYSNTAGEKAPEHLVMDFCVPLQTLRAG